MAAKKSPVLKPGQVPHEDDVIEETDDETPKKKTAAKKTDDDVIEDTNDVVIPRQRIREAIDDADEKQERGEPDSELPDWVSIPKDLKMPTKGKKVYFMRFEAHTTDAPEKGDRHCILWSLTEQDEKMAIGRAGGNAALLLTEMAKMMIRAIDGHVVNWSVAPGPGNARQFWRDIGPACRQLIVNLQVQTSTLPLEDRIRFFKDGFAVRSFG